MSFLLFCASLRFCSLARDLLLRLSLLLLLLFPSPRRWLLLLISALFF
jgi:hypothetical protein